MKLYGIASRTSQDVDDWCLTRAEADAKIEHVRTDDAELAADLYVAEVVIEVQPN
jgi:hypothetical protein